MLVKIGNTFAMYMVETPLYVTEKTIENACKIIKKLIHLPEIRNKY